MPIANNTVNAVSMTVLPDAPTDPVTGLKVPTIAVATSGGVSVIQHNGVVRNSSSTLSFATLTLTPTLLSAGRADTTWYWAQNPGALGASFALSTDTNTAAPDFNIGNTNGLLAPTRSELLRRSATAATVQKLKNHESTPSRGIAATITNTFNTGHMVGDIRRAYLSDVDVGSVTGPELVVNGTFDTDVSGWSTYGSTISWNDGKLQINGNGSAWCGSHKGIPTVVGKRYLVSMDIVSTAAGCSGGFKIGSSYGGEGNLRDSVTAANYTGPHSVIITATTTTTYVTARVSPTEAGQIVVDNISVKEVIPDRSYKAQGANITGTLTRSQVAQAAQLVAYSGFSAENYLREPYSGDLDFGTGEWSVSAWVNLPTALRTTHAASFPSFGSERVVNGTFNTDLSGWGLVNTNATNTITWESGAVRFISDSSISLYMVQVVFVTGKCYRIKIKVSEITGSIRVEGDVFNDIGTISAVGEYEFLHVANSTVLRVYRNGVCNALFDDISVQEVSPALVADRAHSSGPRIQLGVDAGGKLTATANDGTTTRTVTTTAAYNTATWLKAEAEYTTDGTLSILVNGVEVAATRGAPLLTLNNSNAVLTIGNSFAADAPFPGSIALLKLSATAPTAEQATWMYEQEKQMFREGAQVTLPNSGSIVDLAYDDLTDKWIAVSAANESEWSGLVRTGVTPTPAGSYSKVSAASGVQLLARTTTNPGVDITVPAQNLREELIKQGGDAARLNAQPATFDYVGGFTATTTSGSTSITSAAGLTYPVSYVGARVTGSGIPADTFVAAVVGTTVYLTKAATASASAVQISFTDFILPPGMEARSVLSGGANKVEGATKDFVRLFDGFKETIRFGTAPGHTAAIQIQATRSAA